MTKRGTKASGSKGQKVLKDDIKNTSTRLRKEGAKNDDLLALSAMADGANTNSLIATRGRSQRKRLTTFSGDENC